MRQRQKRTPVASSGVQAFLRRYNRNRHTCAKALRFDQQFIDTCAPELLAALRAEFAEELGDDNE